jgi:hypothetical protein
MSGVVITGYRHPSASREPRPALAMFVRYRWRCRISFERHAVERCLTSTVKAIRVRVRSLPKVLVYAARIIFGRASMRLS